MKWNVCYITLNGAEYIEYSIRSILPFIINHGGKIIIIEGSTKYAKMVSPDGNSIDNTKQIIELLANEYKDTIVYKQLGRVDSKLILRNEYINIIRQMNNKPDWILVVDDDELYKTEDLETLDKFLSENNDIVHVFNPQYFFWGDFKHIVTVDEDKIKQLIREGKRPQKIFKDKNGTLGRQGEYHERIFKWNATWKYLNHVAIASPNNKDVYIDPAFENKRLIIDWCYRYHYGFLTTSARMKERIQYYDNRDIKKRYDDNEMDNVLWNSGYGKYLITQINTNPLDNIIEFNGTHPSILESHPYFIKEYPPIYEDAQKIKMETSK